MKKAIFLSLFTHSFSLQMKAESLSAISYYRKYNVEDFLAFKKYKIEETAYDICGQTKSEKCKKNKEGLVSFINDSITLLENISRFNPPASFINSLASYISGIYPKERWE